MAEYIARICYNTLEWKRPSGREGKGQLKDSFEHLHGFGHEEWLFDQSKILNGYHYSFLEPMGGFIYAGQKMDVHLYFYSREFGKLYLGIIRNVECLTKKEAEKAYDLYEKKGWIKEMRNDIAAVSGDVSALDDVRGTLFNMRFRFEDADINLSNPRIISQDDPSTRAKYYKLYQKKGELVFSNIADTKRRGRRAIAMKSEKKVVFNTDVRNTSYDPQHNKMQNAIKRILEKSGEYSSVELEINNVDITAALPSGKVDFYELKTSSAKASIREALGQILEYTHYPTESRADRMIIVGPDKPDEYDKKYLDYLRKTYNLPVWYRSYSFVSNTLSKLV